MNKLLRFHRNNDGVTSVEYAVMLMLIAGSCLTVLQLVGVQAGGFWGGNSEAIDQAFNSSTP